MACCPAAVSLGGQAAVGELEAAVQVLKAWRELRV